MGNVGQCCSGGADVQRCCSAHKDASTAAAPGPVPNSELLGVDNHGAPGMNMQDVIEDRGKELTFANGEGAGSACKDTAEEQCPGGDSAAGGVGEGDAAGSGGSQEYQYVTYEDGSTYTGQIVEKKRHGHGLWQSKTGQYEGQWKEDNQHGKGRQTWTDGRVYDGEFQCGRFSGQGTMVWHTQKGLLTYEGQYVDDLKHGTGKFVWPDGRTYDGEWHQGKRHGRGMYMNARCERKIGYWKDDKFVEWESREIEATQAAEPTANA